MSEAKIMSTGWRKRGGGAKRNSDSDGGRKK
jgi:hypothetical protein